MLILLPNFLDESQSIDDFFPPRVRTVVDSIDLLIAESEKNARRYLKKFLSHERTNSLDVRLLNEHTPKNEFDEICQLIKQKKCALISDAGLSCIADPGSELVNFANHNNIEVDAIIGPSSIVLALMLSGFNSNKFHFHSYLPRKENELNSKILDLEKQSENCTQLFIEAPYRSDKLLQFLIKTLKNNTNLCVCINLTLKDQKVLSYPISKWKKTKLLIGKKPTVFLIR